MFVKRDSSDTITNVFHRLAVQALLETDLALIRNLLCGVPDRMNYGFNTCTEKMVVGPLLRNMRLEDFHELFNDKLGCRYIGFMKHPSLDMGKMITEYDYSCQSPVHESWPLFLIPGMTLSPHHNFRISTISRISTFFGQSRLSTLSIYVLTQQTSANTNHYII